MQLRCDAVESSDGQKQPGERMIFIVKAFREGRYGAELCSAVPGLQTQGVRKVPTDVPKDG